MTPQTPEGFVSLEKYFEVKFIALREFFDYKFEAIYRANDVAYESMEKRLEGMNEFRDTLKDQASRFITRDEVDAIRKSIDADLRVLREYKAMVEGKASQQSVMIAYVMSGIGLLMGILGTIMGLIK